MIKKTNIQKTIMALSLSAAAIMFSGWTFPDLGMGAKAEELVAKQYQVFQGKGQPIALSKPKFYTKDDALFLQNGKKIMDEEGGIWTAFEAKGKMFYLVVNENSGDMKIKSLSDKKVIKDFGDSARRAAYVHDGKLFIATTSKMDQRVYDNVYSNLFSFDGESVDLVQKSIVASGEIIAGLNARSWLDDAELQTYGYDRSRGYKWDFSDLMTNTKKDIKPSLFPEGGYSFLGKKMGYKYEFFVGFVGDTAVYIYDYRYNDEKGEEATKGILEAQNLVTGETYILLDHNMKKYTFLTNGYDVVFKEGSRVIDMRTMRPATIDINFKPIELRDLNSNLGGGYNESKLKEYTSTDIARARGQGKNLFKYRY